MKLIMAVIKADDAPATIDTLTECGYRVTRMATTGGWLGVGNVTLLIGVQDNQVFHVTKVLGRLAGHRTEHVMFGDPMHGVAASEQPVERGGATVFVLDVASHIRL